jgi:hypothetical protein
MSDAISSSPKNASRATSRESISFSVTDVSSLAKSLRAAIAAQADVPSQVQMLNWLAKGAGFRNYQSLRTASSSGAARATTALAATATSASKTVTDAAPAALSAHATKALTQFDEHGKLTRWPHKFAVQRIAMWGLWLRFDAKKRYTEKEVNSVLKAWHSYGDHVTLRRELVNMQLLARKSDCSEYWKVAQQPNEEVKAFLRALRATRA